MVTIIPAILATTEADYQEKLSAIEKSGKFEWVHIDLMDGEFVNNKTINLETLSKYPTNLKKEAHLMVSDPLRWVDGLIALGYDRLIAHIEVGSYQLTKFLNETIKKGKSVALAFNPETAIEQYQDYHQQTPGILIMSVQPGFGGQEFIPTSPAKIKAARQTAGASASIGVDGGIGESSVRLVFEAGVDYVVVGSHLIKGDIDENLRKLQSAIQS